jgi:ribonucleoside-triphosphate reductase (formate)
VGKELLDIDGISRRCLDVGAMSHAYFTKNLSDVTIDVNSNSGETISPNSYNAEIVKGVQKLEGYYLIHRYAVKRFGLQRANELLNSILYGKTYFHDASGIGVQQPYCISSSTSMIMAEGRPWGQLQSLPPKRADSFMAQCIEYCMELSQSFAGAVALADLIVNYAYYAKKENLSDHAVRQDLQKFVHVINNPFRIGGQSPFTNISIFDMPNLVSLFEHSHYPDGSSVDFDYVMRLQKVFVDWFSKGDPTTGLPYRFPIVTLNISCDAETKQIKDKDFLDYVSKVNCNSGCFNIYVNSGNKIASCCRLINDKERISARVDTFGNGGLQIGSHRVVTIPIPGLALRAKGNKEKFFEELQSALEDARDLLLIHREEILQRRVKRGFLKFYNPLNWFTLDRMFSTFGIIGVFETCYFMGLDIRSEEGTKFVTDMLNYIEDFAKKTSSETKTSFNVEEIPGESVASKVCQKDKVLFGEDKIPFQLYSNQYLPLILDVSMPERIETTGKFMEILSGGGILHLNVKEKIADPEIMKQLIVYSVKHGVSHLAINYGFGTCKNGHTTVCGSSNKCSICEENIEEFYTRIVGYFSKVSNWSRTRREFEFKRRIFS